MDHVSVANSAVAETSPAHGSVNGDMSVSSTSDAYKNSLEISTTGSSEQEIDHFASIVISLAHVKGEFTLTLEELCRHLVNSSLSASSRIIRVIRMKATGRLRHEYLLVEAELPTGLPLWLRLERFPDLREKDMSPRTALSRFNPSDKAKSMNMLVGQEDSKSKAELRFTSYKDVTLQTLQVLLSAFIEISTSYTLPQENCWFFASVVLEILSHEFPSKFVSGKLAHKELAIESRDRIKQRFTEQIGISHPRFMYPKAIPIPAVMSTSLESTMLSAMESIAGDIGEVLQYFDRVEKLVTGDPKVREIFDQVHTFGRNFFHLVRRLAKIPKQAVEMAEEVVSICLRLVDNEETKESQSNLAAQVSELIAGGLKRHREAQVACSVVVMDLPDHLLSRLAQKGTIRELGTGLPNSVEFVSRTRSEIGGHTKWTPFERLSSSMDALVEFSEDNAIPPVPGELAALMQRNQHFFEKINLQSYMCTVSPAMTLPPTIIFPDATPILQIGCMRYGPGVIITIPLEVLPFFMQAEHPLASGSQVHQVILRKEVKGVRREFLLVEAESCGRKFWMRLERGVDFGKWRVGRAKFTVNDTAQIASTHEELIHGLCEQKAVLRFSHPTTVTLLTFAALLSVFAEESKFYTIFEENCFFLTAVIMSVLSSVHSSHLEGEVPHAGLGAAIQERIKRRFFSSFITAFVGQDA